MKKSILQVVHESAKDLHEIGLIDNQTMRSFDKKCFPKVRNFSPKEIKQIRLGQHVSQPVFAGYLNASASTVKKWETGEKYPTGPTLKLLNIVAHKGLKVLMEE